MEKFIAGPNPVYVEDDIVHSVVFGPSTLEGVQAFFAIAEPVFVKYGYAFLLTDATRGVFNVTADARRAIAEWSKTHRVAASALFGPGPMIRGMLTLVSRAMSVLGQGDQNVHFFATEAEARTWFDDQREKHRRNNPQKKS